jgi:hypothetical protein
MSISSDGSDTLGQAAPHELGPESTGTTPHKFSYPKRSKNQKSQNTDKSSTPAYGRIKKNIPSSKTTPQTDRSFAPASLTPKPEQTKKPKDKENTKENTKEMKKDLKDSKEREKNRELSFKHKTERMSKTMKSTSVKTKTLIVKKEKEVKIGEDKTKTRGSIEGRSPISKPTAPDYNLNTYSNRYSKHN